MQVDFYSERAPGMMLRGTAAKALLNQLHTTV
jgi:hypothetical protein